MPILGIDMREMMLSRTTQAGKITKNYDNQWMFDKNLYIWCLSCKSPLHGTLKKLTCMQHVMQEVYATCADDMYATCAARL